MNTEAEEKIIADYQKSIRKRGRRFLYEVFFAIILVILGWVGFIGAKLFWFLVFILGVYTLDNYVDGKIADLLCDVNSLKQRVHDIENSTEHGKKQNDK